MKGFISYCHSDYGLFKEFRVHLKSVERAFELDTWADDRIRAGYYWNAAIEKAIQAAEIFILLASPAFIASDYIYEKEIPAIKLRHRSGCLVVPVVLSRCFWPMVADALQAVPTENGALVPISDWKPRRNGFDSARAQIGAAIQSYFGIPPRAVGWSP